MEIIITTIKKKTYHHEAFEEASLLTFHDNDKTQCLKPLVWPHSYTLQQKSFLST